MMPEKKKAGMKSAEEIKLKKKEKISQSSKLEDAKTKARKTNPLFPKVPATQDVTQSDWKFRNSLQNKNSNSKLLT